MALLARVNSLFCFSFLGGGYYNTVSGQTISTINYKLKVFGKKELWSNQGICLEGLRKISKDLG
jgi:hypothetical protein